MVSFIFVCSPSAWWGSFGMNEHATHLVNFRWIIQQFSCSEFSCLWIMVWLQAWPREYQLTTKSSQNSIWKSFPKLWNSIVEKTICTHKLWASVSVFLPWNFMGCYFTWIEIGGFLRETGQEVTAIRFRARLVVLSLLGFLLYPFLWVWTVIGSIWFTKTQACVKFSLNFWTCPLAEVLLNWSICQPALGYPWLCYCTKKQWSGFVRFCWSYWVHFVLELTGQFTLKVLLWRFMCSLVDRYELTFCVYQLPEEGQKWGFLIWLVFSYSGLICIACISAGKVCQNIICGVKFAKYMLWVSNLEYVFVSFAWQCGFRQLEYIVLIHLLPSPGWQISLQSICWVWLSSYALLILKNTFQCYNNVGKSGTCFAVAFAAAIVSTADCKQASSSISFWVSGASFENASHIW
jgi:hypothetical protein